MARCCEILLCDVPTWSTMSWTLTSLSPSTQRIFRRRGCDMAFIAREACSMCSSLSMRSTRSQSAAIFIHKSYGSRNGAANFVKIQPSVTYNLTFWIAYRLAITHILKYFHEIESCYTNFFMKTVPFLLICRGGGGGRGGGAGGARARAARPN